MRYLLISFLYLIPFLSWSQAPSSNSGNGARIILQMNVFTLCRDPMVVDEIHFTDSHRNVLIFNNHGRPFSHNLRSFENSGGELQLITMQSDIVILGQLDVRPCNRSQLRAESRLRFRAGMQIRVEDLEIQNRQKYCAGHARQRESTVTNFFGFINFHIQGVSQPFGIYLSGLSDSGCR